MEKGLIVYVYRNGLGDCTNEGASSRVERFVLIGEGIAPVFEPTEEMPAIKIRTRRVRAGVMFDAVPTHYVWR